MRLGANYTPRGDWFHSWLDLDPRSVAQDFATLADIGLDHVRLFPLWPLLQPSRGLVSQKAVQDLVTVVDLAGEHGLSASVDVLNGHLSSFDFVPSWLSSWHQRNLFDDPQVVAAQADLVAALGEALAERPHATGLCLGNEFPQFAAPRHPLPSIISPADAEAWLGTLLGRAQEVWPEGRHVFSFDDDIWFVDSHPFTPEQATRHGAVTTVHAWVFGGLGQRFGRRHPSLTAFSRYLLELARAWSPDPDRGIWLQEVGAPSNFVAEEDAPAFLRETLLQVADMPGLEAVTWWCSHDVGRHLPDFPELEYTLGLVDAEGRLKPIGAQLRELVPDLRAATPVQGERPELVFDASWRSRRSTNVRSELFDQWLSEHLAGRTPALRHAHA